MSGIMLLRSVVEIVVATALVAGFCFEGQIAAWERRMVRRIKRRLGRSNVIELDRKRSPQDESRAI